MVAQYYYLNNLTQETTSAEPAEGFSIPGQEETYEGTHSHPVGEATHSHPVGEATHGRNHTGFAIDSSTPLMDALERIGLSSSDVRALVTVSTCLCGARRLRMMLHS